MNHITWTNNTGIGRSGYDGSVNGRRLFTIEMSVTRGEGYKLRTRLPFNLVPARSTGETGALKEYAEIVLTRFVMSLGAEWPSKED